MLETCPVNYSMRERSSSRGFPPFRSPSRTGGSRGPPLQSHPSRGHTQRQLPNSSDHSHPLGHANGPARVEQIEYVRALQYLIVGRKHRVRHLQQPLAFFFVQIEKLPKHVDIS